MNTFKTISFFIVFAGLWLALTFSAMAVTPSQIGAVASGGGADWLDTAEEDLLWDWAFNTSNYGNGVTDIEFSSTGTEFWMVDNHNYDIHYISTSEQWNPAPGRVSPGQSFDVSSTCSTEPNTIEWNAAYTEFTISDNTNAVCVYTAGAVNQINGSILLSSSTFTTESGFGVDELRDLHYVNSGNEIHLLNYDPAYVTVYDLTTPYDPSDRTINTAKSYNFTDDLEVVGAKGFDYRLSGAEIVITGDVTGLGGDVLTICKLATAYTPSSKTTCRTLDISSFAEASITEPYGVTVDDTNENIYFSTLNAIKVMRSPPLASGTISWAQTGTGYALLANRFKRITAMSDTKIAVNFGANDAGVLKMLTWGGSSWSQTGNDSTSNAIAVQQGICKLTTDTIAGLDDNTDTLEAWAFDGTDWAELSGSVGVDFNSYDNCINMADNAIAVLTGNVVQKYTHNGVTFSSVGNTYTIPDGGSYEALFPVDADTIGIYNTAPTIDTVRFIDFDGVDWTQTGATYSVDLVSITTQYFGACRISADNFAFLTSASNDGEIQAAYVDGTNMVRRGANSALAELTSWPRECVKLTSTLYATSDFGGDEIYAVTRTEQ